MTKDVDDKGGADEKGGFVGRGGLKLEAALRRLGGGDRIANARALDIGASTGGFTECLLRHGASQVTALEVGHDQLHERLRNDPRVVNLERINFKTVSLQVAPGPFDFFVVDVSFVAARTMLRPLAFRLKPGAEGIILVKPQFELAEGYVRRGEVKSDKLRAWALQRVRKKGESLGFHLLDSIDSPVELESGTVEILTRWRFNGMPEKAKTPAVQPGAKPDGKSAKAAIAPRTERRPPPAVQRGERPARRAPPATNRGGRPERGAPAEAQRGERPERSAPGGAQRGERPERVAPARPARSMPRGPVPGGYAAPRKEGPHSERNRHGRDEKKGPVRATERLPFEVPRLPDRPAKGKPAAGKPAHGKPPKGKR